MTDLVDKIAAAIQTRSVATALFHPLSWDECREFATVCLRAVRQHETELLGADGLVALQRFKLSLRPRHTTASTAPMKSAGN